MPNDHVSPMNPLESAPVLTRNTASNLEGVDLLTPRMGKDDVLLRRSGRVVEFPNGMKLHCGREVHLQDMETRSRLGGCVSVKLFLEGGVVALVNGQELPMPKQASSGRWDAAGALMTHSAPVPFHRSATKDSYLDKVILDIPFDWVRRQLTHATGADTYRLTQLLEADFFLWPWVPSPRACTHGRQLLDLAMSSEPVPMAEMFMKATVLGLAWEAFSTLLGGSAPNTGVPQGMHRLDAALLEVARHQGGPIALDDLALRVGSSLSTLQRLARRAYNKSLQELIRAKRLEEAHTALCQGSIPIIQLAYRAGYSSPANFTTAFRRQYGYPPSDLRRKRATTASVNH